MKSVITICFLMLVLFGQTQSNLVKGSQYLSFRYGASKFSFPKYASLEWGYAFNEKMLIRSGFAFESGKVTSTVFNNSYINADFMYNLFSIKNRLYGGLSVGPVGGVEFIRSDRDPIKDFRFIYGGRIGTELDYLLNPKWSLKVDFNQWYVRPSNLGSWFYTGTIGVGYVIN